MDQWRVPEPSGVLDAVMADGTVIGVRRHGNPDGPRLLLSHGTGLAADLYYPYWSQLTDRFDVCIFDLRSHGWNSPSPSAGYNIPTLVNDSQAIAAAVSAAWGAKPSTGVFHSVSTVIALTHQHERPDFAGLVLFDPPLELSGDADRHLDEVCLRQAKRARRRRSHFDSRHELAELLAQAPAYSLMPPRTLALLSETTLRPAAGGGFELRCPAEQEAQLYEWYFGFAIQANYNLEGIDIPLKAIGADPTVRYSFLPGLDLDTITKFDYDFLPHKTHFLQLEAPEECAELTVQFLEQHGLA
ncbi:MAG: alpha/beta hydrolase [Acidimicrobiaceae bacterium]|nr:alpha/beta hydrolase [Acidimicrobiaceae bacterium]